MRFVILYALFCLSVNLQAQFHSEKLLRPQLMVTYENRFTQSYNQSDKNLSFLQYFGSFSYPVINRINKANTQGTFKFTGLTLFVQAARNNMNDDLLGDSRNLYQTQAGFDFIFIPGNKFYYQLTGKAHRLCDNKRPDINLQYTGLALLHYFIKPVTLHGGIARTMALGHMQLTPVGGISIYWKPNWQLHILYPFIAQLRKNISTQMAVALFVKADGMLYDITNENNFANAGSTIALEQKVYAGGLQLNYDFDDHWQVFAEGGSLFNAAHAYKFEKLTLVQSNL
ncbi:MAG TPA: hypothetical protein PLO59_11160, partial [Bacteroidia bacterium]|nr:hypothetical protein [Bacteroidia bacterium]